MFRYKCKQAELCFCQHVNVFTFTQSKPDYHFKSFLKLVLLIFFSSSAVHFSFVRYFVVVFFRDLHFNFTFFINLFNTFYTPAIIMYYHFHHLSSNMYIAGQMQTYRSLFQH